MHVCCSNFDCYCLLVLCTYVVVTLIVTVCWCCAHVLEVVRLLPPPYRTHSGRTATWRRWLYEQKLLKYRTLVAVSPIWAQLPRRQVAYGYMDCSVMCHLGTILLVA
jgi:hypothetical protein